MTAPATEKPVLCPYCLREILWSTAPAYVPDPRTNEWVPFDESADDLAAADRRTSAYRSCPNPDGGEAHMVPYRYAEYGQPLVVGVIGESQVGKTLLIVAMLAQLGRAGLMLEAGLEISPLSLLLDADFTQRAEVFLRDRRVLPRTSTGDSALAYGVTVYSEHTRRSHAVSFFDVRGEDLAGVNDRNRFIQAVGALIFVVDGSQVPTVLATNRVLPGDPTFKSVVHRLEESHARDPRAKAELLAIPAVMVVAKSDLLRVDRTANADKWLKLEEDDLDLSTVDLESADVYAMLASRGADAWLLPSHRFENISLHYASATNCAPKDGVFPPLSFRQRRVLKPLMSLFEMCGIVAPQAKIRPPAPHDSNGAGIR